MKTPHYTILLILLLTVGCEDEIDFKNAKITDINEHIFRGELLGLEELLVCGSGSKSNYISCQYGTTFFRNEPDNKRSYEFGWTGSDLGYLAIRLINVTDSRTNEVKEMIQPGSKPFAAAGTESLSFQVDYIEPGENGRVLTSIAGVQTELLEIIKIKRVDNWYYNGYRLWMTMNCNLYSESGELVGTISNAELIIFYELL